MKKAAIYFMRFCLSIIYAVLKLLPTQRNKILFLSRQSSTLTTDFRLIQEELKRRNPDIDMITICHRLEGAEGSIKGLLAFALSTLRSMYHTATSQVCVLDAYWPAVSILKHKKSLTVIQLWHALGKIKQSGYQTLGKESGRGEQLARLMKMHEGYDYIIAGGKAWNPFYCRAFNTTEDKLVNCGLPRIDYLLETAEANRKAVLEKYPQFKDKTLLLYAPTFRRNIELRWQGLAKVVHSGKTEIGKAGHTNESGSKSKDFALVIKGHPNQRISLDDLPENERNGVYTCPEFSSAELLAACDYLVTDYSAIAIEAAVLNKPTYYFVYDYDEYREKNGMNIDLFEEMPSCVFKDAKDLITALQTGEYPQTALDEYRKRFLPEKLGTSTEQIAELILKNMKH